MKLMSILHEIQVGRRLGAGSHNTVYLNDDNTDTVIKFGPQYIYHASIFKKFPQYFPIVYEINKKEEYLILEKLDVDTADDDIESMYADPGYLMIAKSGNKFKINIDSIMNPMINKSIKNSFKNNQSIQIFNRISEIVTNTPMRDIKNRNFGYTKSGILKALDI